MKALRIYYCKADEHVASTLAHVLKLFGRPTTVHSMSRVFDLCDPDDELLLLWSSSCGTVPMIDWLILLDREIRDDCGRHMGIIVIGRFHSPFLQYLECCGALRYSLRSIIVDLLQEGTSHFHAATICDSLFADSIIRSLAHGQTILPRRLAQLTHVLPQMAPQPIPHI